jgi:hypothetical protein
MDSVVKTRERLPTPMGQNKTKRQEIIGRIFNQTDNPA